MDHRVIGACRPAIGGCATPRSRSPSDGAASRLSPCVSRTSATAPGAEPFSSLRGAILARLDAVPQTLSHFDFHPANIFPASGAAAVIDWAYCGCGPIGADAGVLASDALADELVPPEQAALLVNSIWEAYRNGLADEALAGSAAEVYAVGTAMRYAWFPAWIAGEYGPKPDERRSRGVVAAHAAFAERATEYL